MSSVSFGRAKLVSVKVVLLAGGLGTRMREETEFRPKPMVDVGGKPVLWHIMKIFAGYGHTDFVICAGYKGDQIKNYFYNYATSNMDFTVKLGRSDSAIFHGTHDEDGWTVTVADTGFDTPTGGRISRVQRHLNDEPFFATYGDGIASVDIRLLHDAHRKSNKIATLTVTKPLSRFGVVEINNLNTVQSFKEKPETDDFVNIGYFVFEPEIFNYLTPDSILETEPLTSLAAEEQITAHIHDGFWQPMDTMREHQVLNDLWVRGRAPWKTWSP